jgi:hypothetical protein
MYAPYQRFPARRLPTCDRLIMAGRRRYVPICRAVCVSGDPPQANDGCVGLSGSSPGPQITARLVEDTKCGRRPTRCTRLWDCFWKRNDALLLGAICTLRCVKALSSQHHLATADCVHDRGATRRHFIMIKPLNAFALQERNAFILTTPIQMVEVAAINISTFQIQPMHPMRSDSHTDVTSCTS